MKSLLLLMFLSIGSLSHAMIVRDPNLKIPETTQVTNLQEYLPTYNPFSIFVPTKDLLSQLPPDMVLDMGAAAFSQSFYMKSLYFYTNAIDLFPDDTRIFAWANYETGYIYYNKRQPTKALEYFNAVINTKGVPVAADSLAKTMVNKIVNAKEYKVFLKQEDVLFLEDKKAQQELNKQIAKEERAAEKRQRALAKERKKREKEEAKALKEAEKARKKAQKEEAAALKSNNS